MTTLRSLAHGPPYGERPELGRRMPDPATQERFCSREDGFRGMWHGQTPLPDSPYAFKYSGGLATYPYQTRPMALYAAEARRTFFCWGGTTRGNHLLPERYWDFGPGNLLQMVSCYNHDTGRLARPVCVFDKWCADPHDNPALQLDCEGRLWLFSPSHGPWTTRSFIHRSRRPYDIGDWETVSDGPLFAYPQPWYNATDGFCLLHVVYDDTGRGLHVKHSADGRTWTPPRPIASICKGHYAVSWADPATRRIGVAFDYHPPEGGLDARTNLYYLESRDWGRTWRTIEGEEAALPLTEPKNPALALDLEAEGELNYLRDLKFDAEGRPVILFVTARSWKPGPEGGPRAWNTVRWDGARWIRRVGMPADNNYDHGELAFDADGAWRLIAPTEPGPQPGNPGGEVALWISRDRGATWRMERQLTRNSSRNHTFCRQPLNAHPDFFAFWADGDARAPSESILYFCDREGRRVRRMPPEIPRGAESVEPETD